MIKLPYKPLRKNRSQMLGCLSANRISMYQRGVVLFFSLIALVIMSLAAVALIRSVDTNNQIAGNLGFKQSTMFSSDTGVNSAMAWIKSVSRTTLYADSTANGYFASIGTSDAARAFVDANGVGDTTDTQGNTIRYVINRMCDGVGDPATVNCLRGPPSIVFDNNGNPDPRFTSPQPSITYRVTARVTGPKNTVSYIQTFVY